MGGYWVRVLRRAWADTKRFFGWNKRTIAVPCLFIAGSLLHLWRFGVTAMMEEIDVFISYALVPVGGFTVLLFFWNTLMAPARMEGEAAQEAAAAQESLRLERDALQAQVKVKQRDESLAEELQAVFDDGSELLSQRPKNYGEWTREVIAWFQDAESKMESSLPGNEIHMFKTISRIPKSKQDYIETKAALDARLNKLRMIISRLLVNRNSQKEIS